MKWIAALLLLTSSALGWGQVPAKLGYQGRLLNADGSAVNGVQTVTFALYTAPVGGGVVWTETQQVAFSNGFYSTVLGDATDGGLPPPLVSGSELYLEVTVGQEVLSPRQRIDSVAYALKANDASSLGGTPASGYQLRVSGTCAVGSFITGVNADGTVSCAPAAQGTSYSAGSGLLLNGTVFSTDPTVVQGRVNGSCSSGFITAIAQDGSVICNNVSPTLFIQNQNAGAQAASFNVSGTGAIGGGLTVGGAVQVGAAATAPGPCDAAHAGSLYFDTSLGSFQGCNGTGWGPLGGAGVPTGTIAYFQQSACPAGWAELTALRGRYVVGWNPANGSSLGVAVGTALADQEDRATGAHTHAMTDPGHTHAINDPGHTHSGAFSPQTNNTSGGVSWSAGTTTQTGSSKTGITLQTATTGITIGAASGAPPAGTNAPYLELLACQKQ